MLRTYRGYTLIELMVVVAIIAIISSVAFPSYRKHVTNTRRTEAQTVLMEAAQFMERKFTEINCYNWDYTAPSTYACATATTAKTPDLAGAGLKYSPKSTAANTSADTKILYSITVSAPNQTTYEITATPVTGRAQAGNGNMKIDQLGRKFWDENADGDYADSKEDNWEKDS